MWIEQSQISSAARTDACSVCGSNVPEVPALSTGVDVLYEGIIEVCQRCIIEAAAIYGLVSKERLEELKAELAELQEWAENAYLELSAKQGAVETLSVALSNVVAERDSFAEKAAAFDRDERLEAAGR